MFKPIQETLFESIFDSFEQYNDLFRQARNQLLSERLALIIGSQEINADNEMQDDIDRLVEEKKRAANFKMCPTCKQKTPFSRRTCRLCKTKLVKYDVHFDGKVSSTIDPYNHFNVKPLEKEIEEEKERQRKWIFLENHGGIMNPSIKLIFNGYRCSCCDEKMYGRENFEKHLCTDAFHLAPVHEFDWTIPQSGLLILK